MSNTAAVTAVPDEILVRWLRILAAGANPDAGMPAADACRAVAGAVRALVEDAAEKERS